MERILVIDDDPGIQRALRRTLEPAGYEIVTVADGGMAMDVFRAHVPSLVVLDLRLPGKMGQDLCREMRSESTSVPILVLSAVSDEIDKVLLLELGADDYITKPFSPKELLARVQVAVNRSEKPWPEGDVFRFGDLEVNFSEMQVCRSSMILSLTPLECKLLRLLLDNLNSVVPMAELLTHTWDDSIGHSSHALRIHVVGLRQKLESDPANPEHLLTVHGVGYKFVP